MEFTERRNLLTSSARVQAPWIKVTIGDYTFGVFDRKAIQKNSQGFATSYKITYPNYIQSLNITKINGQVNKYTLRISYPVTPQDDPNFFEKVFSSVSKTRKIVFSYGDTTMPTYIYKDEEAIITNIKPSFNIKSAVINYDVYAVSSGNLSGSGAQSFPSDGALHKPSDIIKKLFRNSATGLKGIFTGMSERNLSQLVDGSDKAVLIDSKMNISILDYLSYLVSLMIPAGASSSDNISPDIYILTFHDDTTYDKLYGSESLGGPYFKVTRTTYKAEQSDAYEINIGLGNESETIITDFSISENDTYSLFYDYQEQLSQNSYISRINSDGQWENVFAPTSTTKNDFITKPADITWWTKVTQYPITATVTLLGLLRPAMLMTYVRLNVIFPGGHKHNSSGLYIVTSQQDSISGSGYFTTLNLTRISGDNALQ